MDIKQGWCSKTPIIHLLCGPDVLSLLQNLPHVTLAVIVEQGDDSLISHTWSLVTITFHINIRGFITESHLKVPD